MPLRASPSRTSPWPASLRKVVGERFTTRPPIPEYPRLAQPRRAEHYLAAPRLALCYPTTPSTMN